MKKIIYNRPDGGVSVCTPTDWILSVMSCGGAWDHLPRGVMDRQIASMVARGVREDVAYRYAMAVTLGGCTTSEALEIIRDRDCPGLAHELWDAEDVPTDRWFRDAWRRSHNGGPMYVNLELARPIQMRHIASAIHEENKRRENGLLQPIEFNMPSVRRSIASARSEKELRSIWPLKTIPAP